jgi:hypothetical protein
MAEEGKASQSARPVPEPLPEPDLDALLSKVQIPDLAKAFGPTLTSESGTDIEPEQSSAPPPTEEPAPIATPEQPGVDPAEPLVEEPEPAEQPPEEQPKFELPDSVQKRIDTLTAKRKAAEEQVAILQSENAQLKAKAQSLPPVVPTEANPLADIENFETLAQRLTLVQQAKTWAIENLDGGQVDMGEGKTQFLDGSQVKKLLAKAENMITVHFPQHYQLLTNRAQFEAEAKRDYPNIFKPGTAENVEFNTWCSVFPACRAIPDISLIVGDAIVGRAVRMAKRQKTQQKGNGQSPPLATPAPSGAPRVVKPRALSSEELSAIANDPNGGKAFSNFVDQLIAGGRQAQAEYAARQRSQR